MLLLFRVCCCPASPARSPSVRLDLHTTAQIFCLTGVMTYLAGSAVSPCRPAPSPDRREPAGSAGSGPPAPPGPLPASSPGRWIGWARVSGLQGKVLNILTAE